MRRNCGNSKDEDPGPVQATNNSSAMIITILFQKCRYKNPDYQKSDTMNGIIKGLRLFNMNHGQKLLGLREVLELLLLEILSKKYWI